MLLNYQKKAKEHEGQPEMREAQRWKERQENFECEERQAKELLLRTQQQDKERIKA